jgi:hypothetical protein
MRQDLVPLIASAMCAVAGLSACGITGGTSRITVDPRPQGSAPPLSEVRIASAAVDADAAHLFAVGTVHPWGRFDDADLKNLEGSLRDSIAAGVPASFRPSAPAVDVHVVVRRYLVAVSNSGGAVFATVAWAASTQEGKPLFQEEFYASDWARMSATIGALKDAVHEAIVRRVAVTSMALASGPAAAAARPTAFDKTSTSFEEAAARVPGQLASMGNPGLMGLGGMVAVMGALIPQNSASIPWSAARQSKDFDWSGYLDRLYAMQ